MRLTLGVCLDWGAHAETGGEARGGGLESLVVPDQLLHPLPQLGRLHLRLLQQISWETEHGDVGWQRSEGWKEVDGEIGRKKERGIKRCKKKNIFTLSTVHLCI